MRRPQIWRERPSAEQRTVECQRKRCEMPFDDCFVQLQRHCEARSRENSVGCIQRDVEEENVSEHQGSKAIRNQEFFH